MRKKKAIINVITTLLLQLITILCGFIIPKLIISNYGSKVNGAITSINQFLAYITLLEAGFGPVIISVLFKPIANKNKREIENILKASERIFKTISYIFIVYIIILCFILPVLLKNEFDYIYTFSLIIIISISTFAEYFFGMTYRLYLQAEQKKYVVSTIQIATVLLNTISVIILTNLKCSIQLVKLASSLIFVLRPLLQNLYVKKVYKINLKDADPNYKFEQKWDGLVQHIAYVIHTNADVVILTISTNIKEVSIYSIYLIVIEGVKKVVQSFTGGIDSAFGDMIAKEETNNLNKKFNIYEGIYSTIATILFSSTLFLIVPFVKVYTNGITDANYVRTGFAYIFVIAEFIFMIRQMYYDLVKVAGHFKQTKRGAYIESLLNVVISLLLVWKFGLIGVALGTLVAMTYRTIEIMYYTSKNILNRSITISFKRILIIAVEFLLLYVCIRTLPNYDISNYKDWFLLAIKITSISTIITLTLNGIIYKENVKQIYKLLR